MLSLKVIPVFAATREKNDQSRNNVTRSQEEGVNEERERESCLSHVVKYFKLTVAVWKEKKYAIFFYEDRICWVFIGI